jgi:hypothetical protein
MNTISFQINYYPNKKIENLYSRNLHLLFIYNIH